LYNAAGLTRLALSKGVFARMERIVVLVAMLAMMVLYSSGTEEVRC
jgi:hypothetical protein